MLGFTSFSRSILVVVPLLATAASPAATTLIISELVDGPLPGGQPKWVEITNCGPEPTDLTEFSIGVYNNGSRTLGNNGESTLLTGTLAPADSFVYVFSSSMDSTFEDVYGAPGDQYHGIGRINGNDVIVLFFGLATGQGTDATIIDIYGIIGTDGTGEAWDYTDSYASRNPDVIARATFDPTEWFFAGREALVTGDEKEEVLLLQTLTSPGAHDCVFCRADLDESGAVDFGDVLVILGAWGMAGGPADLDGSGFVDFGDLLVVLAAWGSCA